MRILVLALALMTTPNILNHTPEENLHAIRERMQNYASDFATIADAHHNEGEESYISLGLEDIADHAVTFIDDAADVVLIYGTCKGDRVMIKPIVTRRLHYIAEHIKIDADVAAQYASFSENLTITNEASQMRTDLRKTAKLVDEMNQSLDNL